MHAIHTYTDEWASVRGCPKGSASDTGLAPGTLRLERPFRYRLARCSLLALYIYIYIYMYIYIYVYIYIYMYIYIYVYTRMLSCTNMFSNIDPQAQELVHDNLLLHFCTCLTRGRAGALCCLVLVSLEAVDA